MSQSRSIGHCLIERDLYERLLGSAVGLTGLGHWDVLNSREKRLARLWAEAVIYQSRVISYAGLRQVGAVETPSHSNVLRYQTTAMYAASRRLADLLSEIP
jgi:hypothetical protein